MADLVDTGGWVPLLDTTEEGPVTCEVATQTEGLFYPSSRTISKAIAASEVAAVSWAFKKPQIGVFSPGRGKRSDCSIRVFESLFAYVCMFIIVFSNF